MKAKVSYALQIYNIHMYVCIYVRTYITHVVCMITTYVCIYVCMYIHGMYVRT